MPNKYSIQEMAAAIKRREPRLAGVSDEELVRKVLERRPELVSVIQGSEPRPRIHDRDFASRFMQRVTGNLNPQSMADAIHEAIQNKQRLTQGGGWKEIYDVLRNTYKDPANVAGDVATMLAMGKTAGEFSPKTVANAPSSSVPFRIRGEDFMDMTTRRGPGEAPAPSLADRIAQQRNMVDMLKERYARERVSGDTGMFQTGAKLRAALDELRKSELDQWGPKYQESPKQLGKQGGAGANFTAEDLEALKKKYNIQ